MTTLAEVRAAAQAATPETLPDVRPAVFEALYNLGVPNSDEMTVIKALAGAAKIQTKVLESEYRKYRDVRDKEEGPASVPDDVPDDVRAEAERILMQPDIPALAASVMQARGVVGESRTVELLYAALTSRLTNKPISVLAKGRSSSGKSYVVQAVLDMMPADAAITLTAMSSRALVYTDLDLRHKHIVIYEEDGNDESEYIVRSLLSEGRVSYMTVDKAGGELKGRHIIKEGPTGLITTGTRATIREDNETRAWSVYVDDSKDQTRRVLESAAARAAEGAADIDVRAWQVAQALLEPADVVIEYAPRIYQGISFDSMPNDVTRLRRDFERLLQLVKVMALLHQRQRDRDDAGRIIATRRDYEIAYRLSSETFTHSALNLSKKALAVAEAVTSIWSRTTGEDAVTVKQVAKELGWARRTAQKWIEQAEQADLVSVRAEAKGSKAATYEPGQVAAEGMTVLPAPDTVFAGTIAGTGGVPGTGGSVPTNTPMPTNVPANNASGTTETPEDPLLARAAGGQEVGVYHEDDDEPEKPRQARKTNPESNGAEYTPTSTTPPHRASNGNYDLDALEKNVRSNADHLKVPGCRADGIRVPMMIGLFKHRLEAGTFLEEAPAILAHASNHELAKRYTKGPNA